MAFFKFRKHGDEPSATSVQHESVEMMRKRAKHRLIGAAVLVLLGVVGFPLLFDRQPRPISIDMPIEIPDRNTVKPLTIPQAPAAAPAAAPPVAQKSDEKATVAPVKPTVEAPKTVAQEEPKPVEKPAEKPAQTVVNGEGGAKALALLEGKEVPKKADADSGRYVVQIGAFSDAARAREIRMKVERAGMKTYTHIADIKGARVIRVRVGPFSSRAEADKAAEKIKKLDLPAAILTL